MAASLSKREELLGLIPELQCHKCKNVPGPTQKDRYSCTNAGHTLCEEHKAECPCGSLVGKSPSPFIAKFLLNKPWMCQNYRNGCLEMNVNVEDLDHHQQKCIYRQVFCPNMSCEDGDKVLFKDIFDHLKICMNEPIEEEEMFKGGEDKLDTNIDTYVIDVENTKNAVSWYPSKMTSTCGAVFITSSCIENKTFYTWCCLLGSSDEANNYSCAYSVTNKIGEKFNYSGPVHILDKKYDDIIASGSLLGIGIIAVRKSLNAEEGLQVKITIRNLKEEAKDDDMESGVSDGE